MKCTGLAVTDPDLAKALSALKRAAVAAWRLSVQTGTPFYVMENGRVVNRNPKPRRRGSKRVRTNGRASIGRR